MTRKIATEPPENIYCPTPVNGLTSWRRKRRMTALWPEVNMSVASSLYWPTGH